MGTTQHLKSTYGSGYVLEMNVEPSTADIFDEDAVATQQKHVNEVVCQRLFNDARCTEQFGRHCVYQVPQANVGRLSDVFSALQQSNACRSRCYLPSNKLASKSAIRCVEKCTDFETV